jgi:hypothetical protein
VSDTPRTDQETFWANADGGERFEATDADFARELEKENAMLRESMREAWKIVNAMAGQEHWQRAEEWLAENIEHAPREIISANVRDHRCSPEASATNK